MGSELDFETAISIPPAPNSLAATVVNEHIDLKFNDVPNAGSPDRFQVWRAECPAGTILASPCSLSPTILPVQIGTFPPGAPLCDDKFQFCDGAAAKNVVYLYFVTVALRGGGQSGPSNIVAATR